MTRTPITPFCITRASDHEILAPYRAIFDLPMARRVGLRAIAQRYTITRGLVHSDGEPRYLLNDTAHGIRTISQEAMLSEHGIEKDEVETVARLLRKTTSNQALHNEMLYVTSYGLWLIILPRLVLMQADDIAREIGAAKSLVSDVTISTIARAACATLRLTPPVSSHDMLASLSAIDDALKIACELAPFSAADFACAIAAG